MLIKIGGFPVYIIFKKLYGGIFHMGKKMKKLICALLASAMLVSSVGIVAFADADKN